MKIISQTGQYDGLKENRDDCITVRVSRFNDKKNIRITDMLDSKVVRLLLDAEPENEEEFIEYLKEVRDKNPGIELHVNVEVDRFFELAKKITKDVKFSKNSITLWPDQELKDRTYLNLTDLSCPTMIPLQYAMWHDQIENADSEHLFFFRSDIESRDGTFKHVPYVRYMDDEYNFQLYEGSNLYDLKSALVLKKRAYEVLATELKDVTECNLAPDQKLLVLMKYFKDHYVYEENPKVGNMRFIDSILSYYGSFVLSSKQGVCEGIAEAFMMLLNNPVMKIDCRCVKGLADKTDPTTGHSWNVVRLVDEKDKQVRWFYFDPTWGLGNEGIYKWSFLHDSDLIKRKAFNYSKPRYESDSEVLMSPEVMEARLKDALERIEKRKNRELQIRLTESLEDISNNKFHK